MNKLLFILVLFTSLTFNNDSKYDNLPRGVRRFDDGNIQCYLYFENAISCVRN